MSEQDTDKTNQPTEPEKPKVRDEHGLTLGSRTMLRVLMEYGRIVIAAKKIGVSTDLEDVLQNPTLIAEVLDLMVMAAGIGERIGTTDNVNEYLAKYREQDNRELSTVRTEIHAKHSSKSKVEGLLEQLMARGGRCDVCGTNKCLGCGECHACAERQGKPLN